jgi:hypothetical protein
MSYDPYSTPPKSRPLRAIMIAMGLAFLGGLAVMGWAFMHWAPAQKMLSAPAADAPPLPTPGGMPAVSQAAPTPQPAAPPIDEARVSALEAKLADIDRRAAAASDQASRAEGLLLAAAARRAVDRGVPLGYLEGQLNAHYGTAQPLAVANIIAASQTPVTLESLRAGLDGVMIETAPSAAKADWWGKLRANFSGLITVRKAGEPSAAPDERLARARLALTTGAVENALAEVARLSGGASTNGWIANARRYIEAHKALDLIETAALTRPDTVKSATPSPPAPNESTSNTAGTL